jgi:hypothetical protein
LGGAANSNVSSGRSHRWQYFFKHFRKQFPAASANEWKPASVSAQYARKSPAVSILQSQKALSCEYFTRTKEEKASDKINPSGPLCAFPVTPKNGSKETVPNDWQPRCGARDASWSYRRAFFRITLCDDVDPRSQSPAIPVTAS